ncbi:MAG: glycosyltransferase family 39 protein [Candidatus Hinthialibacter antarcticus]|nr:glycosyltransferase family 39 protein [Candidatus Hinthialibacter antarcticus]
MLSKLTQVPGWKLLLAAAMVKLLIHFTMTLALPEPYGMFRDEYYYIACADHLDWGYVDHPPLCALLLAPVRMLGGESLFALRLLPAIFGAAVVFLAGWITAELGGKRFAQWLAVTATIALPSHLAIHTFYSMNPIDHFFWALAFLLIIKLIQNPAPSLWIALGVALGLGLQNKISVLFLGFGFAVGILLTPQRKWLLDKWLWICGAISMLIFLPHIIWQVAHGWPTLEFIHNASQYKNTPLSPLEFLKEIMLHANPFALPIWTAGLIWLLLFRDGAAYRLLGWLFVAVIAVFLIQNAKPYYLAPAYPLVMAAGAVCWEKWLSGRLAFAKPILLGVIIVGGVVVAPIVLPVLSPAASIQYSEALGIRPSSGEKSDSGALPQLFADMIGWEDMARQLSEAVQSLPENERANCVLIVSNYGQAGAIDFFRDKYNLPPVLCPHNNYWYWADLDMDASVYITIISLEDNQEVFETVEPIGEIERPLSMPYENNRAIYRCADPKTPIKDLWRDAKKFI